MTVHGILEATLPAGELSIYEAGGGSTSFLPLKVLHRAHVTVVDIDEDQIRNNDYAQETILGDVQSVALVPASVVRDLPQGMAAVAVADPPDQIPTALVWRTDDPSPVNRAFREAARAVGWPRPAARPSAPS